MAKRVGVDKWLFGIVLLLVLFGLVEVFSASAVMAQATVGSPYSYVAKQALWVLLGLIAMVVLMQVDYRRYNNKRFIYAVMVVEVLLLLAVFAMHDSHHTHRWIRFGGLFTFQPSEIAKPVLILFLAYFLQSRMHLMDDLKGTVLKAVALPALITILIAGEPDLGTALVCVAVTVLMLYLAGAKVWHLSIPLIAATPALAYMLIMVPWRLKRMQTFMNPEADPKGAGFHILQSLFAVWTG